ncbi:competence protein ComK [Paraliobacillus sp. JSM ZJ581]
MLIEDQYIISKKTLAIIPASAIDYHAMALETSKTTYVKQTPLEIIQHNCINRGATFHGRRVASQQLLGKKQKVPILMSERPVRYVFPTQSPNNFHCSWIIANHVFTIESYKSEHATILQTTIYFKSKQTLHLMESTYQIKQQYQQVLALHQALKNNLFH